MLLNCTESFFKYIFFFFYSRYLHSKLVFVHFLQSFPALCLFILWVLQTTFQVCHNKVRDTLCVTADLFSRRLVILPTNLSLTTKILHFLLFHFYVIFALKIEEKLSQWFPLTYFFLPWIKTWVCLFQIFWHLPLFCKFSAIITDLLVTNVRPRVFLHESFFWHSSSENNRIYTVICSTNLFYYLALVCESLTCNWPFKWRVKKKYEIQCADVLSLIYQ